MSHRDGASRRWCLMKGDKGGLCCFSHEGSMEFYELCLLGSEYHLNYQQVFLDGA